MSKVFSGGLLGQLFGIGRDKPKPQPVQRLVDQESVSEAEQQQSLLRKEEGRKRISSLGLTGGALGDSRPPRTSRATLT